MSKFKTSYSIKSEEQFVWLRKLLEPDSALSTICNKVFIIDEGRLAQARSHQKSRRHKEKEPSDPNQRPFVVSNKRSVGFSSGKLSLTTEKLI